MRQADRTINSVIQVICLLVLSMLAQHPVLARTDQSVSIDGHSIAADQVAGMSGESPAPPPLEMCSGLTTHQDRTTIRPVARPPFMTAFKEPGFGTRVTRITDSSRNQVNKPAGSPMQAWNSDESLLLLLHRSGEQQELILHHGHSYAEIGALDLPISGSDTVHWSHVNPDILYVVAEFGPQAGQLLEVNVRSQTRKPLTDLAPSCRDNNQAVEGGFLARPSADDDLFVFACGMGTAGESSAILSYRRSNGALNVRSIGASSPRQANARPQPLASGVGVWFAGTLFDDTLSPLRNPLDMAQTDRTVSIGRNADGDDTLYQSPAAVSPDGCDGDAWRGLGLLVEHELADGSCRTVINQSDGYPQLPDSELFASAHQRPEWLVLADTGYDTVEPFLSREQAPLLYSEIVIVDTTPDVREVCRLAHHRSFGSRASNGDYPPRLGEPSVTQSPFGTRVLFASDWYDSGLVDTYVVELPSYTRHDLSGRWVDRGNPQIVTEFVQAGTGFNFHRTFDAANAENSLHSTGSGRIEANQLAITYTVTLGDGRDIPGECEGDIPERDQLSLQCSDHHFGRQSVSLHRP